MLDMARPGGHAGIHCELCAGRGAGPGAAGAGDHAHAPAWCAPPLPPSPSPALEPFFHIPTEEKADNETNQWVG